jgi:dTDP-4-amino-4,6-dideoxygalactose transaminase
VSYNVRFVYPTRAYANLKAELDNAYFEVMTKGDLIDRGQLRSFEDNFARFVGTKYAVGLNSGYDALQLSLRAAGVGLGDEVIVPSHTFVATASAVVNVGAKPVLVDVGKDFNIAVEKIEEAISSRTKALLPVHLNGYMADMAAIMKIAERHNLAVVEDACQSLGANQNGRPAGSWGLTGCWSFYPFKMLGGYGDGGAITTNDENVADYIRRMRYNGEDRFTGEYHGHGFTCLLDNLQAAFLDVKLRYLSGWIQRRREIAERYHEAFSDIPDLMLPHYDTADRDHVYQNYVVRSLQGNEFSEYLKQQGVEVLVQFRKPYYRYEVLALEDRGFPETEALSREVCSLPMAVEMTDQEVDYVIQTVRAFTVERHSIRRTLYERSCIDPAPIKYTVCWNPGNKRLPVQRSESEWGAGPLRRLAAAGRSPRRKFALVDDVGRKSRADDASGPQHGRRWFIK